MFILRALFMKILFEESIPILLRNFKGRLRLGIGVYVYEYMLHTGVPSHILKGKCTCRYEYITTLIIRLTPKTPKLN